MSGTARNIPMADPMGDAMPPRASHFPVSDGSMPDTSHQPQSMGMNNSLDGMPPASHDPSCQCPVCKGCSKPKK